MSDTISCVINVFRTDNGESIGSVCTFMPGVRLIVNSRFLLLLSPQINSPTELRSSTGMIILAGLLLSPLSELLLVVGVSHPIAFTAGQNGRNLTSYRYWSCWKIIFFFHLWFTNLFVYLIFFNNRRGWLNWSNCWEKIYVGYIYQEGWNLYCLFLRMLLQ